MRPIFPSARLAAAGLLPFLTLLSACGGGGGDGGDPLPPPVQAPVEQRVAGEAVFKVRGAGSGWVAMVEKLQPSFTAQRRPVRRLLVAEGATAGNRYAPPEGWSLLDFAVHPSREISAVIATDSQVRLLRLDRRGAVVAQFDFQDAAIPVDPYIGDPNFIPDHKALLPRATRDAVRLAPLG